MKKGIVLLVILVMLMSCKPYNSNILSMGTNNFGVAIIGILGALLMRSTKEKK